MLLNPLHLGSNWLLLLALGFAGTFPAADSMSYTSLGSGTLHLVALDPGANPTALPSPLFIHTALDFHLTVGALGFLIVPVMDTVAGKQ